MLLTERLLPVGCISFTGVTHKETPTNHDDVVKWKQFPCWWPFVRGIHRSPLNCPHKGQWHGALKFSLICARINGWLNNREAGNLRRHRAHYDVIVMKISHTLGVMNGLKWYLPRSTMELMDASLTLSHRKNRITKLQIPVYDKEEVEVLCPQGISFQKVAFVKVKINGWCPISDLLV